MDSLQTPDRAVRIATDLVNTHRRGEELLRSTQDLREFLLGHAEPEPVHVSTADLAGVRVVRQRLRAVFEAETDRDAAAVINMLLAEHATRPYLSDHDGTLWHVHVTAMDAGWPQGLAAISAHGLATLVAGHGFAALRRCVAAGCDIVFITTAKGRARRYCSQTCATRARVAAHRARRGGRSAVTGGQRFA